ncbi:MAG: PKD domain-containing protein [Thermoplasmata archaeon]
MALDPTTDRLYTIVNVSGTTSIAVVDASNGTIVNSSISANPGLTSLAFDSTDGDVYGLGANVTIVNATSLKIAGPDVVIAPHVAAGAIAYDPSREDLFATTMNSPTSGTVTVIDGSSTYASYEGVAAMAVGQGPVAVLPVTLSTGELEGTSELWVANSGSGSLSIIASSPPKIDGFTAAPELMDLGQTTHLVLTYSGGAGPSVVSYSDLPSGCSSANTTDLVCTPSTVGSFEIGATVTDALGNSVGASTNLTVGSGLTILTFIAPGDFPYLELGFDLGIYPTVVGGVAPYHFAWSFGDGTMALVQNVTHSYSSTGVYLLQLNVTDSVGGTGTVAWLVDVYSAPEIGLTASTLRTDVGSTVSFTTSVTGGVGNGTTFWSFGDVTVSTGPTAIHAWTATGLHLVTATYQDLLGDETNATVLVRVNDTPAGEFVVTGGTPANPARPGTLFYYNVTLNGGTGPFAIVWNFGDGSQGPGIHATHAYSFAGNYTINVTATDAAGVTVNASLAVEVLPALGSPGSSSGSSYTFPLGIFLGIVVGMTAAALLIYAAGGRRKKPKSPPPPSPYVPPRKAAWKED